MFTPPALGWAPHSPWALQVLCAALALGVASAFRPAENNPKGPLGGRRVGQKTRAKGRL